jgi:glycosyltransferase involved in cell wall biosynthesis
LALNYLSYAFSASLLGPFLCRGRFDIIFVCQLSPVTVALPGILLKWIKRAPLLMWVLDLWPDSLTAAGGIRSPKILGMVDHLVRFIYKQCDRILLSSEGFKSSVIARGVELDRLRYFPNWVEPLGDVPQHLALNLPQGFRIVFTGNIGVSQDFETILSTAERLKEVEDIHWIIVGDGRQLEWVRLQVQQRDLAACFHLMGRFPLEAMPYFFEVADALLVTLKPEPAFALTIPGKVQSYMASGKPILAALDGEGARLIQYAGAGYVVSPGDSEGLMNTILRLYRMPVEERIRMGTWGKDFSSANFDRDLLFGQLETWISELIPSAYSQSA